MGRFVFSRHGSVYFKLVVLIKSKISLMCVKMSRMFVDITTCLALSVMCRVHASMQLESRSCLVGLR
ncbi:hypothetical protein DAI22_04g128550 [Oryza sativa Japonica Group]|nr:hypothetical protein DAI22_04g128550 [Oryza sativa Japonica Group]